MDLHSILKFEHTAQFPRPTKKIRDQAKINTRKNSQKVSIMYKGHTLQENFNQYPQRDENRYYMDQN